MQKDHTADIENYSIEEKSELAIEKFNDAINKIFQDFLSEDELIEEVKEAYDVLRAEITDLKEDMPAAIISFKQRSAEDEEIEKVINICFNDFDFDMPDYLARHGYAVIKIENMQQCQKLESFINEEIHPIYRDQKNDCYPL